MVKPTPATGHGAPFRLYTDLFPAPHAAGRVFFASEDNGLEPFSFDQTLPFKCCQDRLGQSGLVILWQIRRPMHSQFQFFNHGYILPHRPAAAN